LTFSSSPYEVVYWIPENTIAPIAKRAPNEITFLEISIIIFLICETSVPFPGDIEFAGFVPAHHLRYVLALS
jgi:hypothetical protein